MEGLSEQVLEFAPTGVLGVELTAVPEAGVSVEEYARRVALAPSQRPGDAPLRFPR